MKKIKKVFFVTLAVYLIAIIVVNQWSTIEEVEDLYKIKFISYKKGDYGFWFWNNYDRELQSDNPDFGNLYLKEEYCRNLPKKIQLGKSYVVYMFKYQAHTWKDFFLFGTKYDYAITSFITSTSKNIDETFSEELKNRNKEFLYGTLLIIGFIVLRSLYVKKFKNK